MSNLVDTNTLKAFSDGFTEEDKTLRNKYLVMMHILSTMQMTVCRELEYLLNKQGVYRHEIKHNHKNIRSMVEKNYKNIFGNQYQEWIDLWIKDYDRIEEIIINTIKQEWGI